MLGTVLTYFGHDMKKKGCQNIDLTKNGRDACTKVTWSGETIDINKCMEINLFFFGFIKKTTADPFLFMILSDLLLDRFLLLCHMI